MASLADILTVTQNGVVAVNNLAAQAATGAAAWTPYTPVITAFTGTFTTVSATGRYKQIGKTVFFQLSITITTNGTAAGSIIATLPAAAQNLNFAFVGRENAVTGFLMIGFLNSGTQVYLQKYDGTYLGADGYNPVVSGSYEAA